jgi:hypothetical protein
MFRVAFSRGFSGAAAAGRQVPKTPTGTSAVFAGIRARVGVPLATKVSASIFPPTFTGDASLFQWIERSGLSFYVAQVIDTCRGACEQHRQCHA